VTSPVAVVMPRTSEIIKKFLKEEKICYKMVYHILMCLGVANRQKVGKIDL